jgi:hypothetical protein
VGPQCGNDLAEGVEACDGDDLRGQTCVSLGYSTGTLACSPQCTSFVTAGCTGTNPTCGDDEAEGLEVCDGDDLRGQTCQGLGYVTGTLACTGDCAALDDAGCTGVPGSWTCSASTYAADDGCDCACGAWDPDCDVPGATYGCEDWEICVQPGVCASGGAQCGNGVAEGYEWCDGDDLRGRDCASVGYAGGVLACAWGCAAFDVSGCIGSGPVCGNAVADGTEACDLLDLRGRTCASFGYTGGGLACRYDCGGFDFSACTGGIPGWTCPPASYGTGDGCDCGCGLVDPDCANATVAACARCNGPGSCGEGASVCPGAIDPANNAVCESSVGCGNGTAEGVEMCDGEDLRGATCTLLGLPSGTLLCRADCGALVTTGCNGTGPVCGDDAAEGAEWCDGEDLRGLDCTTFGFTSGTLACVPTCNGYDDSACL